MPHRLIGCANSPNMIEEFLKNCFVKNSYKDGLTFTIETENKEQLERNFTPEQILIGFLTKVGQIIQNHSLNAAFLAISVPEYMNYVDRNVLYNCGIAAGFNEVILVD